MLWRFWEIIGTFGHFDATFGYFWLLLTAFSRFWQLLAMAHIWPVCWPFWSLLAAFRNFCHFWQKSKVAHPWLSIVVCIWGFWLICSYLLQDEHQSLNPEMASEIDVEKAIFPVQKGRLGRHSCEKPLPMFSNSPTSQSQQNPWVGEDNRMHRHKDSSNELTRLPLHIKRQYSAGKASQPNEEKAGRANHRGPRFHGRNFVESH